MLRSVKNVFTVASASSVWRGAACELISQSHRFWNVSVSGFLFNYSKHAITLL